MNPELYKSMLWIRMVEEEIARRYPEQQMRCPTHLSIGQEAVAAGVSAALNQGDKAYSSHRAHAHYLAKGGCVVKLIAELHGKNTGCTGGRGGSMHLCDLEAGFMASTAIVANSIPVAVGHALHMQIAQQDSIVVTYFGEGATEEGAFYESMNFAALRSLPVLFVCENNRYSVYSPLRVRQPPDRRIADLARAIGVESREVDGNDVEQVFAAASEAKERMLNGAGPVLLECHTYRHREHCGPNSDDDLGYRDAEEVAKWLARDPLTLASQALPADADVEQMKRQLSQHIDQAFQKALEAPFPSTTTIQQHLYA